MKRILLVGLSPLLMALAITDAVAVVGVNDRGNWPEKWPKELEPLREASRTIDVATGLQQKIYEIPIPDRTTFEKVWPAVLEVRTPGSPLTLYRKATPPPKAWGHFLSNKGEIPEWAVMTKGDDGRSRWVPADPWNEKPGDPRGFYHRVRIDVELVVDGEVIDLNRVAFPEGVAVFDRRFDAED